MYQLSKQGRIRLVLAFVLVFLAVFAGGAWYFFSYRKTPEFTLEAVTSAIRDHDVQKFETYVNLDTVLDQATDDMIQAFIETESTPSGEEREALQSFAQVFKAPLALMLRSEILQYVKTGTWANTQANDQSMDDVLDANMVLTRTGLKGLSFRSLDYIATDKAAGTAVAGVRVYQERIAEEFVFQVKLERQANGLWQVTEVENFKDYVLQIAKRDTELLQGYMEATGKIIQEHAEKETVIAQEMHQALAEGSLGNDKTRAALKKIATDEMVTDWQARKDALSAIDVPAGAEALQKLRLRICDLYIAYAKGYAAWMDDKNAATIRQAQDKLKQAKTLEFEEAAMARHMGAQKAESNPTPKPAAVSDASDTKDSIPTT